MPHPDEVRRERVSKYLSNALRHKAVELGLNVRPDGYVKLAEVWSHDHWRRVVD